MAVRRVIRISHALCTGFRRALEIARNDDNRAIAVHWAGYSIAGADVTEFGNPHQAPSLPDMLEARGNLAKITGAAIHGSTYKPDTRARLDDPLVMNVVVN